MKRDSLILLIQYTDAVDGVDSVVCFPLIGHFLAFTTNAIDFGIYTYKHTYTSQTLYF